MHNLTWLFRSGVATKIHYQMIIAISVTHVGLYPLELKGVVVHKCTLAVCCIVITTLLPNACSNALVYSRHMGSESQLEFT